MPTKIVGKARGKPHKGFTSFCDDAWCDALIKVLLYLFEPELLNDARNPKTQIAGTINYSGDTGKPD